ncbi:hypothetical protein ACVWYH_001909 [Bradyrhizobium sp. GM24.11]
MVIVSNPYSVFDGFPLDHEAGQDQICLPALELTKWFFGARASSCCC